MSGMGSRVSGWAMKLHRAGVSSFCVFYESHRGTEMQTHLVIRSSIDRGSKMNVGRVIRLRSAPGRSCEIMWVSTAGRSGRSVSGVQRQREQQAAAGRTIALLRIDDGLIVASDGGVVAGLLGGGAAARQRVSSVCVAEHHGGEVRGVLGE